MVNEYECELLGLDVKKVKKLEKDIRSISRRTRNMGLHIFGGSASSLRYGSIIISDTIGDNFDGGDGGTDTYNGVQIGETSSTDTTDLYEFIDKLVEEHKQMLEQEMLEEGDD